MGRLRCALRISIASWQRSLVHRCRPAFHAQRPVAGTRDELQVVRHHQDRANLRPIVA